MPAPAAQVDDDHSLAPAAEAPARPAGRPRRAGWSVQAHLHALIALTLLPLLAFVFYDAYEIGRSEFGRAQRQTVRLATRVAEDLSRFLDDTERLLSPLAQRAASRAMDAGQCDPLLEEVPGIFPEIANVGLRNLAGELICSRLPPQSTVASPAPWFDEALQANGFSLSGALLPRSGAPWVALASRPVLDGSGRLVGLLSARLDLQQLQARVTHSLPPGAVVSVVDRNSVVLMRSLEPERWIGAPARDVERIQRMRAQGEGFGHERGIDGQTRLYSFRTLLDTGWMVIAGLPEDAVLIPLWQRIARSIVAPIAALLLALLLARLVSRRISGALLQLSDTALRVARGESNLRAMPKGPQEVAVLAHEFNRALDAKDSAQASARESNRRFRETLDNVALLAVALDEHGALRYANGHFARATGWPVEEVLGRDWFDTFAPPERHHRRALFLQAMQGGMLAPHTETVLLTRSGERRLVRWSSTVLCSADGRIEGLSRIGEDITAQVAAERRLQRLRDFYEALSRTNAAIVRMVGPERLYMEICAICVDYGHAKIAYIALVQDGQLRPVAWAGPAERFLDGLSAQLPQHRGQGPVAQAMARGEPYISNDFLNDPQTEPWRERASHLDTRATAAFPLRRGAQVVGALSLHVPEPDFFDAQLIGLLSEMVNNLGFALDNHDREAEARASAQRIEYLATHDGLTGLPNRTMVRDRIGQAIAHARRHGQLLAVACVDLDRFKHINDGFGHGFGDALLEAIGQRLLALVREGDTVARPGGDEFLLVLGDLRKLADVYRIAQKILDAFETPVRVQEREVFVTASIGLCVHPQDGADAEQLLGNADLAMYRAKQLGGGTYQFFTAEMGAGIAQRVEFENRLRQALAQGQLQLAYQPKVELGSGRIVGAEALLRWQHPELGTVSPARFIPIAEETGLIVPIGDWVLRTACAQNQAWRAEGLPPITVAVNVSVRQFQQSDLLERVRAALADSGLGVDGLELELTESVIAQDADNVVRTVGELRKLGVRLSVDDFGTGYSSLSYLKRFDVNALKIDQSFVRDLLHDPDDAAITLAVISLARSLRMTSVAEGVETAEQCAFLREHGCDEIQGYYCSRPVPAEALAQMLREGRCLAPLEEAPGHGTR